MLKRHMPSLTALQCFEAVARHLSFTRASEELALTQSAVSKQVAQLEEVVQHLRVATLPTFGARWLVPRLKGWRLRHPNIHLDVFNEVEPDELAQGRSDVSFYFGQSARPGAECVRLFGEEMVPVCAPSVLPAEPFTDPTQLTDLVLLQNATRPEAWHEWFYSQERHTEHSYHGPRFDSFYMCIRAAQVGCGVALLPRFLVEEELAEGKLVIPWQHSLTSNSAYYLAYAEHAAEVPKVRDFVRWIHDQLE
jgi:DNA-binding transcriptional LysR family regulator